MRGEHIATDQNVKTEGHSNNKTGNYSSSYHKSTYHHKVDINDLLSRAREDEKKQKKENLIFFGLIASVIAITGIIASL